MGGGMGLSGELWGCWMCQGGGGGGGGGGCLS
jgi:hypothetical protein